MNHTESYKKCEFCNADCVHMDTNENEPCWGKVIIEFEGDGENIHTCRGHQWIWSNEFYRNYAPEGDEQAIKSQTMEQDIAKCKKTRPA